MIGPSGARPDEKGRSPMLTSLLAALALVFALVAIARAAAAPGFDPLRDTARARPVDR